jgi:hypothetical protein
MDRITIADDCKHHQGEHDNAEGSTLPIGQDTCRTVEFGAALRLHR